MTKVKRRKQAIAIGLDVARRTGNPDKVGVVMREFKHGTLKSGSGSKKGVRRRKKHPPS